MKMNYRKQSKNPPLPGKQAAPGDYLKRHYAVLTPKVRKLVKKLEDAQVNDIELSSICEELVFRTDKQQIDVLNQFLTINDDPE